MRRAGHYEAALAAKERALGPSHPELVPTLNNRGLLLAQLGQHNGAEAVYRRAVDVLEQAGLAAHPQGDQVRRNLRSLARRREQHARPLVDIVVARLRELGATVAAGRFQTTMQVALVNDGPATILLEL